MMRDRQNGRRKRRNEESGTDNTIRTVRPSCRIIRRHVPGFTGRRVKDKRGATSRRATNLQEDFAVRKDNLAARIRLECDDKLDGQENSKAGGP